MLVEVSQLVQVGLFKMFILVYFMFVLEFQLGFDIGQIGINILSGLIWIDQLIFIDISLIYVVNLINSFYISSLVEIYFWDLFLM